MIILPLGFGGGTCFAGVTFGGELVPLDGCLPLLKNASKINPTPTSNHRLFLPLGFGAMTSSAGSVPSDSCCSIYLVLFSGALHPALVVFLGLLYIFCVGLFGVVL